MSTATESAAPAASHAGRYLTVGLAGEAYGLPVLQVREIIRLPRVTPVPQLPDYVKGVINLRGRVIPVVDLRVKLGLAADFTERTCIVVVQVAAAGRGAVPLGLIVDAVEEVVNLSAADIEPPPEFGALVDLTCILGMARVKGEVKTLLHLDRVIGFGPELAPDRAA